MNSQFAVFLPLGSCDLKTQGLMENSELSSINTICGDCMVRDGGKKKKKSQGQFQLSQNSQFNVCSTYQQLNINKKKNSHIVMQHIFIMHSIHIRHKRKVRMKTAPSRQDAYRLVRKM